MIIYGVDKKELGRCEPRVFLKGVEITGWCVLVDLKDAVVYYRPEGVGLLTRTTEAMIEEKS